MKIPSYNAYQSQPYLFAGNPQLLRLGSMVFWSPDTTKAEAAEWPSAKRRLVRTGMTILRAVYVFIILACLLILGILAMYVTDDNGAKNVLVVGIVAVILLGTLGSYVKSWVWLGYARNFLKEEAGHDSQ